MPMQSFSNGCTSVWPRTSCSCDIQGQEKPMKATTEVSWKALSGPGAAILVVLLVVAMASCGKSETVSALADQAARAFIQRHVEKTRPLEKTSNLAWWSANLSGKPEDFKTKEEAENALDKVLSDPKAFEEVKGIKDRGGIRDPLLKRQID